MLLAQHADADRVALDGQGGRSAADLIRAAAVVARALPEVEREREHLLLDARQDRYAFVVGLLGAWSRGYIVDVAPVSMTRERQIAYVQRPDVRLALRDTACGGAWVIDEILAQDTSHAAEVSRAGLPHSAQVTRATPSKGSTNSVAVSRAGLPQQGQLCFLNERDDVALSWDLATLHELARACWSRLCLPAAAAYLPTLSQATPLGFVLGCFGPLCFGGAFVHDALRALTERGAWPQVLAASVMPSVVVSPASHVRLMLRSAGRPLARASQLISVGPELPARMRALLTEYTELTVHELGDTALRTADDVVSGAALGSAWERSIAACEEQLAAHDAIREVALVPVPDPAGPHGRLYLLLVVCDDDASVHTDRMLEDYARTTLARQLPDWQIEQVRISRVSPVSLEAAGAGAMLRRDAAGRHELTRLYRAFDLDMQGKPLSNALSVRERAAQSVPSSEPVVYDIYVPEDYVYFDGHFPGYPILPGAVQLSELVLPCVRRVWPELQQLKRMLRLKFQERILPGDELAVVLTPGAEPSQVDFAVQRGATLCAAGRLVFALQAQAAEVQP